MMGSRGIWQDGWKAAAVHAPLSGNGNFDADVWELYNVAEDRSESNNLADENPEKLQELIDAWYDEAAKNNVLPMDDRVAVELLTIERPTSEPARVTYVYYPNTACVPEGVAVNIRGRDYKILANVEVTDEDASGVLFARGSRFGGHSLFIKDGKLNYVYNFLGIKPEQVFTSEQELAPGSYTLGMDFTTSDTGENGEILGSMNLYVDDQVVVSRDM